MISEIIDNPHFANGREKLSALPSVYSYTFLAIFIGSLLALGMNLMLPDLLLLAKIAMFPMGVALSMFFTGSMRRWRQDIDAWGLIIVGQLFGILGALLIFLAAIL